jgi:hypothetical protein
MHAHQLLHYWRYPFILGAILLEIFYFLVIQHRAYPFQEMFISIGVSILRLPMRLLRPLIVAPVAYFLWSNRVTTLSLNSARSLRERLRQLFGRPAESLACTASGQPCQVVALEAD